VPPVTRLQDLSFEESEDVSLRNSCVNRIRFEQGGEQCDP